MRVGEWSAQAAGSVVRVGKSRDAGMNARAWLTCAAENRGFGGKHLLPAGLNPIAALDFMGETREDFIVSEFGRKERVVERGQFQILRGGGEHGEAFARTGLDAEHEDNVVERFRDRLAFTNQITQEGIRVRILVCASEAASRGAGADESPGPDAPPRRAPRWSLFLPSRAPTPAASVPEAAWRFSAAFFSRAGVVHE